MKIIIEAEPKEIAAFLAEMQERQISTSDPNKTINLSLRRVFEANGKRPSDVSPLPPEPVV